MRFALALILWSGCATRLLDDDGARPVVVENSTYDATDLARPTVDANQPPDVARPPDLSEQHDLARCGGEGEPCCANDSCDESLTCGLGVCVCKTGHHDDAGVCS